MCRPEVRVQLISSSVCNIDAFFSGVRDHDVISLTFGRGTETAVVVVGNAIFLKRELLGLLLCGVGLDDVVVRSSMSVGVSVRL